MERPARALDGDAGCPVGNLIPLPETENPMNVAYWHRQLGRCLPGAGRGLAASLLNLIYPEKCVLCDAEPGERAWPRRGAVVPGLRWYDGPHLCLACAARLGPRPVRGVIGSPPVPVHGACQPGAELVETLGRWKYHGVRGLAWPLAGLLDSAVNAAVARDGDVDYLVPVALHGRRRRERGFNQAEVLAHLVGPNHGVPVAPDILRRTRSTGQQAKLKTAAGRQANLAGAFVARDTCGAGPGQGTGRPGGRRVGLVDDLVTSGATCAAAAEALAARGWQVRWVVALGLAAAAG